MAAGKSGIGRTVYEEVKGVFWTVVICTAVLCLLFGAPKGVAIAGKGVDVVSYAAGATFKFLTQRAPDAAKSGSSAAGSAPTI